MVSVIPEASLLILITYTDHYNAYTDHTAHYQYRFAEQRLPELLKDVSVTAGKSISIKATSTIVTGECANAIRKAKKIVTYVSVLTTLSPP